VRALIRSNGIISRAPTRQRGRLFAGGREALFVYGLPVLDCINAPAPVSIPRIPGFTALRSRGADLYVSTHAAIYVLEGAVLKRADIKPKRTALGSADAASISRSTRECTRFAFGPEGDLYFSGAIIWSGHGDFKRADHWGTGLFPRQVPNPVTTVGMVARISPDGELFAPVARGLRNCCASRLMRIGISLAMTMIMRVCQANTCRAAW